MLGIIRYLCEDREAGANLMRLNDRRIFFRKIKGRGPPGMQEMTVRRERSVGAARCVAPPGAAVRVDLDRDEADALWIARESSGEVAGCGQFDSFRGAGEAVRAIAGRVSERGCALILLPEAAVVRLERTSAQ